MLEDMTLRNLSEGTQQVYIRSVRACCRYCNKKPSELTFEDVRTFRLHLVESGLAPGSVNGAMVGLRFFFRVTLGRPEALDYIPMAREPQRLPTVLGAQEVARLLDAAPGLKWRTAYLTALYRTDGQVTGAVQASHMAAYVKQAHPPRSQGSSAASGQPK
jgi:site-specific recombinase XerD